jgi:hypothetical protein
MIAYSKLQLHAAWVPGHPVMLNDVPPSSCVLPLADSNETNVSSGNLKGQAIRLQANLKSHHMARLLALRWPTA